MSARQAYADLTLLFRRLSAIEGALAVLNWDRAAMMPAGGAEARAGQVAELETLRHNLLVDPATAGRLAEAAGADLGPWERANLAEMGRIHAHAAALPADLVAAKARACAACEMAWREARREADFSRVASKLALVLSLVREEAAAKAAALGLSPYDALLDAYEPGGRIAAIDALFADLAAFLPPFLARVLAAQEARPAPLRLPGPFPVASQRELARRAMAAMGFEFARGRLDESAHPFCGGVPDDVRLTTRYDESDPFIALFSVIHETGHALYEQGLPAAFRDQPVGLARSMSIHEGQSLCMEMQAARSVPFLSWLARQMAGVLGGAGPAFEPANVVALAQRVERGFIRVDADEVTYPLHIILRTRLERAMIADDLAVADLPEAWDAGFVALLGQRPPDHARGCLQDIHWYDGDWGYFPTYTLGAMTAAQLFAAARERVPGLEEALGRGDFSPLVGWLRPNVHEAASSLSASEILIRATGRPLSVEPFKAHLEARYGRI